MLKIRDLFFDNKKLIAALILIFVDTGMCTVSHWPDSKAGL